MRNTQLLQPLPTIKYHPIQQYPNTLPLKLIPNRHNPPNITPLTYSLQNSRMSLI
jgi:hypothetical protein